MGQIIITGGGGGGVTSDDVTATKARVLAGYTALTSDSGDEIGTGTLPLASVMANQGGTLPLASVLVGNGGTMPNNGALGGTIGVNGSYPIPAGYTSGGTVSQNITTYQDSGNTHLTAPAASKSYPAGYYYNAHGADVSISWYSDLS